jgi:pentatricopeptide repeat protein
MLSIARLSVSRETVFVQRPVQAPVLLVLLNKLTSTVPPNPPPKLIGPTNQIIQFAPTHHQDTIPSSQLFNHRNLFSQLKSPPHLFEARRLHALLVVNGFFHPASTDRVFGSQLVNIYVNFGCFQGALLVFDKLPQKSNIAWNAILRGLVDRGQFSDAIQFYHLMLSQGIAPDNFTYPLVLKACSGLSALEEGRRVLEYIQFNETRHNIQRNIYVDCALIDMFAKCGSLNEARWLFEEMPRKDLASWSAITCGSVHNGEWLEALCLFKRMRLVGIWPDSVIVAAVLPACGRLETRHTGMAMHGCAVRSGFESDLFVSNALVDMYCKCGDTHDANCIFCKMEYRDAVSWGTLIAGYAQNCLYRESFELYLEMKSAGLRANAITAASTLPGLANLKLLKRGKEMHGYILKQGFESDAVVGSSLIDMYTKCGSMREAKHIFQMMSERDISIWNSLIVGYVSHGDTDSALRIFRQIWKTRQLRPNSITLVSILPLCTKMGTLTQGKEIHGYATKSSLVAVVSVGNSLIDVYCKCGYLELGIKVFNQMMVKNIVTYNTVISAHGIHGLGEEAFSFFEQMKEERIRPNKVSFIALLSACSHAGIIDKGWLLYNSMMADYRIQPEMEHYCCMVDLLGRAGNLDDALNFIKRMPVEPDINVLGSLLGACRVHNKLELAELLGKHILQKNLKDSGYYVLLANIYASTKRWKDVSEVRRVIKEKGLMKKPGSSWIQLGSCIHVFHSRGIMHPQLNKIQEILKRLLFEMKVEGYMPDQSFFSLDLAIDADE